MKKTQRPFLIAMITVLVASACLVGLPVPASSPAGTLPAFGQTQVVKPVGPSATFVATRLKLTQTPSITMTSFPSITPLPSATATATETPFGFAPTGTPVPATDASVPTTESADPDEGYTDEWGSTTRCSLISKSPEDWTVVPPLEKYKVSWTLFNSGTKTWQANEMILTYIDGAKLTPEKKDVLKKDVRVGQTITPVINIYPPKAAGKYKSVWGLRMIKTGHIFCTFTIKIAVR